MQFRKGSDSLVFDKAFFQLTMNEDESICHFRLPQGFRLEIAVVTWAACALFL